MHLPDGLGLEKVLTNQWSTVTFIEQELYTVHHRKNPASGKTSIHLDNILQRKKPGEVTVVLDFGFQG